MTRVLLAILALVVRTWPPQDRERVADDLLATVTARADEARARVGALAQWRCLLAEIRAAAGEAVRLRSWRSADAPPAADAMLAGWRGDVVRALRLARRRPVASAGIALTVAAVVAATTTAVGIAVAVLWRPLPYPDAARLVFLWEAAGEDGGAFRVSGATYDAWRRNASGFEAMAIFNASAVALELPGGSTPFHGLRVSPDYFATLGVTPLRGRTFSTADDGAAAEIVLSERAWRARFAADPEILGRTVRLSGAPYTVIGVMPDLVSPGWPTNPAHVGIDASEREYWMRLPPPGANQRSHVYGVIARLAAGASLQQALAELSGAAAQGDAHTALAAPFREQFVREARTPLLAVLAAVVALLLTALANLASLQATAFERQRHEFGIRTALGAGRLRLVRALAVDVALHVAAGLALGLPMARVAMVALPGALPPTMPFVTTPAVDATIVGEAVIVAMIATVLMAAWPAVLVFAGPARASRTVTGGHTYRGLVVLQVALGVAAAVPAVLLGRSLTTVLARDAGFTIDDVVVADVSLPGPRPGTNPPMARVTGFQTAVLAALSARADVRGAAFAYDHPLEANWSDVLTIPSQGSATDEQQVQLRIVSPGYFRALEVGVRDGRTFGDGDTADRPGLAVINQAFADRLGRQALGLRLSPGGPRFTWGTAVPEAFTVVGIVENERFRGIEADAAPAVYLSTAQFPMPEVSVLVRSAPGRAEVIVADLPAVLRRAAADASIGRARLLAAVRDLQLAPRTLTTDAVAAFAVLTVALAMLGVYGVLNGAVAARRREVGVRLALGEAPGAVARRIVGEGLATVGVGLALGLLGAAASGRLVAHELIGVSAGDPGTALGVAGVLIGAAIVASLVPAWRAARVDPIEVLRADL